MKRSNIALIGFMGAGKSSVGRALAGKLHKRYVELDALIEKRSGKSINDIFASEGEPAFRKLEAELTAEVAGGKNQVIGCGGGVVLNQVNINNLKESSAVIYLEASPEVILQRTAGSQARPLLKNANREGTVRKLLEMRLPLYDKAADITIDTSDLSIDEVVQRITKELQIEG